MNAFIAFIPIREYNTFRQYVLAFFRHMKQVSGKAECSGREMLRKERPARAFGALPAVPSIAARFPLRRSDIILFQQHIQRFTEENCLTDAFLFRCTGKAMELVLRVVAGLRNHFFFLSQGNPVAA